MDYKFIGWNTTDNHDKVWAAIKLRNDVNNHAEKCWNEQHEYLTVWGRRGKKLQFNAKLMYENELEVLIRSKVKKGYEEITETKLDEVYPEFEEDMMLTTAMAKLSI